MIVPFSMKLWCLNEELVRFVSPYTGAQSPTRVWFSKWVCMISTFRKSVCPLNWHAFELYAYAYARGMLLKKKACNCQGLVIDCRFSSRGERAPGRAAPAGPNSLSWQRTQRSRMVRSRTALGLTICSSWPCSGITSLCTCMLKSCCRNILDVEPLFQSILGSSQGFAIDLRQGPHSWCPRRLSPRKR